MAAQGLVFRSPIGWPEVFDAWRAMEESLDRWQTFWTERGYASWEAWRIASHRPIIEARLTWGLYDLERPFDEVPRWRGGMFPNWNRWFYSAFEERPPRLADLVAHPGIANHFYIRELARTFPQETMLLVLRQPNGDISMVEGMHRACAIALLARDGRPLACTVRVMLADWPHETLPSLGAS